MKARLSIPLFISAILIFSASLRAPAADTIIIGKYNPHYLSNGEWKKWRVLCAKIDNEIEALHRRINVLKDMQNNHGKPEELKAMAAAIRSSIDEVFNEVNTEMSDRKLFKEDSKVFMGKLVSAKQSLEALGKF